MRRVRADSGRGSATTGGKTAGARLRAAGDTRDPGRRTRHPALRGPRRGRGPGSPDLAERRSVRGSGRSRFVLLDSSALRPFGTQAGSGCGPRRCRRRPPPPRPPGPALHRPHPRRRLRSPTTPPSPPGSACEPPPARRRSPPPQPSWPVSPPARRPAAVRNSYYPSTLLGRPPVDARGSTVTAPPARSVRALRNWGLRPLETGGAPRCETQSMAVGPTTAWSKLSVRARVLCIVFGATGVLVGGWLWVAGYPAAIAAMSGLSALALIFIIVIGTRSPQ